MTTTTTDVATIRPITHREATGLAEEEYRRFAELLGRLGTEDWHQPTACPGWTVRDLAGHVVGAMRSAASVRELLGQQREIKRRVAADGANQVDHMTALQIELTADLDTAALVRECRSLVGPAARGRKRTPAPIRRFAKIPVELGTIAETWNVGYLVDTILTRDTWMHRVDVARAVGADLDLDAEHDGRIVADIVAEWGRRHGGAFELSLDGPAGGHFSALGADPERITLDAVEFCLVVSGRSEGAGLLAQQVPF